ncbi:cytochrome c oxidase subunit 3 [Mariniblastus sp.]|nr:cytochrome c oxidase subunit 3 [Mariniblastus sp.]
MENAKKLKRHPGLNLIHGHGHEAKNETALFGFWVFMMSDLILFGLLFAVYLTTIGVTAGGPGPKELFDFTSLGIQTALLLTSSMTIGMAMFAMKHPRCNWQLVPWLLVTLALGIGFLFFEVTDFINMAAAGGVPSRSGYLSAFYALVGLHGFHVAAGSVWMIVLLIQLFKFGQLNIVKSRFLRLALLWHFLDVIWIGIFNIVFFYGWLYG